MKPILLALASLALTPAAFADVTMRFDEGAPKDRFSLINQSGCPLGPMTVTVDLSGSAAGLVFDVTGAGAGVEVYQPFELVAGADVVTDLPVVSDGDTAIELAVDRMPPGAELAFTIDVDDTMGGREITVSDAEITGAEIRLDADDQTWTAQFDGTAQARLAIVSCLS